jgi:hypothetical protein
MPEEVLCQRRYKFGSENYVDAWFFDILSDGLKLFVSDIEHIKAGQQDVGLFWNRKNAVLSNFFKTNPSSNFVFKSINSVACIVSFAGVCYLDIFNNFGIFINQLLIYRNVLDDLEHVFLLKTLFFFKFFLLFFRWRVFI